MLPHNVPVTYRTPFAIGATPYCDYRPEGDSILDIVRSVPNLPRSFLSRGVVCINGEEVPRELWSYVRPRPATEEQPIAVTLHWPLQSPGGGGGRSGLKSVLSIVAAIALVVVTAFILGPGGVALVGTTLGLGATGTAATLAATAVAAAVGIAGSLAISALTAPPTVDQPQLTSGGGGADVNADQRESAGASGNTINPGGSIPRVVGHRKVFPPFVCEPLVELIDQDEYVEALVALNGPHLLEDIRVDGVAIDGAEDITVETREGWPNDTPIESIIRQGRTSAPQLELSQHRLSADGVELAHQSLPEQDLPVWHGVASRNEPDEIWIHLLFPGGLAKSDGSRMAMPLRIRFRLRGDVTWINCPEVHIADETSQQLRREVRFMWQAADALASNPIPDPNGFYYAHINVPTQTATPSGMGGWVANSYFNDGSGNDYAYAGNESSSAIRNIGLFDNRLEVYLDEGTFPKGIYEIEIKRGSAYVVTSFTKTTYGFPATIYDFFGYFLSGGAFEVAPTHTNVSDRCILTRVISTWPEHPVAGQGFALIALKSRNRALNRISVNASGYVRDWDGSSWNTWTTTSNPAPHYADILSGSQNLDPLPADLRDDAGLAEWREVCLDNDWTCDAIIDDMRTQDALSLLASCAYAKPYQSDQYGVTVDKDVSAQSPIQVFSRMNTAGLKYEKAFARVPEGFVVSYRDELADDDRAQTVVYQRDPTIATTGLLETISYEGVESLDKVRARALFDLDQANLRSTFYSFDADIESIVCRRGSLVALQHDVLTSRAGDAHIKTKTLSGGNITGFVLDSVIPITNEPNMHVISDMHVVTDMHNVGMTTGVAIRRTDGTISTHQLSNSTGESATITLATPFANVSTIIGYDDTSDEYGCLLVCGDLDTEYRRMLVLSIAPTKDLKASLTLVDEATELVRFSAAPIGPTARAIAARFNGSGGLSASTNFNRIMIAARFSGGSSLSTSTVILKTTGARFDGAGNFSAYLEKPGFHEASILFSGAGSLSALDTMRQNVAARFDGVGNVSTNVTSTGGDSFTKILLHFDGTDGSTSIIDAAGHTWTAVGAAQLDTGITPKFGTAACLIGFFGDYVETPDSADFTLGSGDWTVDFWFQPNTSGNTFPRNLFAQCDSSATDFSIGGGISNGNVAQLFVGDSSGSISVTITGTTALTTATWNHYEACRTGNTLKMFVNGVQEGGDASFSGSIINSASKFVVGNMGEVPGFSAYCSIDEFRLSVGIARHTSNFTPPSAPY